MVIGVLKEIKGNEYRVAAVPATVHEIVRHIIDKIVLDDR